MSSGKAFWKCLESVGDTISIYDGPSTFLKQFSAAPVAPRDLFAAHWCQSEVCNGGFAQFFGNSTGVLAPEAVNAFRVLGMPQTATALAKAISCFGPEYPRDRTSRQAALAAIGSGAHAIKALFSGLEREFYSLIDSENGGFVAAADAYAEAHAG
jgi:hypothetical protein